MKVVESTYPTRDLEQSADHKEFERSGETGLGESHSCHKRPLFWSRGSSTAQRSRTPKEGTRAYYKEIKDKMKKLELPLWNKTATTWTRDESPKHRIPKAERFTSLDNDLRRNGLYLKLDLSGNIQQASRGRLFAKSKRVDHFLQKKKADEPSPAAYDTHRFLDNSKYKNKSMNPSLKILKAGAPTKSPRNSDSNTSRSLSPNKFSAHYDGMNHTLNEKGSYPSNEDFRFDELKGRTISRATKYHKLFLSHGKQFAYNEHFGKDTPGVGAYTLQDAAGKGAYAFSLRKVLYRFNERIKYDMSKSRAAPGPAEYVNNPQVKRPSTMKSTITESRRLDLARPLNITPGPAFYNITRYLEKKEVPS